MVTTDDKKLLIVLARKGHMEGEDGFKHKFSQMEKNGIKGPGHDYGLDWSDKPFYRSALWEATWKNNEQIVKMLVEKNATIDFADFQGRTPLHEAAYYGHRSLVEYLLEKGHPIDPTDNFGATPLFRAVEGGRDEIIDELIKRSAQINALDAEGCTVQHLAAFNGTPDISDWLHYKGSWKNRFAMETAGPPVESKSTNPLASEYAKEQALAAAARATAATAGSVDAARNPPPDESTTSAAVSPRTPASP